MSVSGKGTDVARTKDELDVERHFLGTTVRLTDGSEGLVFSRGPKNESNFFLYNCHLCGVPNLPGERCFQTHVTGRKHQTRLTQPIVDAISFRAPLIQKSKIQMNIAPGEPVPPGFENEVKPLAEIQTHIDVYKGGALIGIEYTIELVSKDDKESSYICLLCDKRGDPRTIFSHWSSYNHRLKYLEKHFPSVIKELVPYRYNPEARNVMPRIVQMITEAVEDHHGRLCPTVVENNEFARNRAKILQDVVGEKHFDEKSGPTFVNVIDRRTIDDLIKNSKGSIAINIDTQKKRDPSPPHVKAPKRLKSDSFSFARKGRDSLDSISSDSGSELIRDRQSKSPSYDRFGKKKRKSQSPAYRVLSRVKRSPPFEQSREPKERKSTLPTPKELSKQASEIAQERYKWEKYRCLVENATKDLEKVLKDHEKNPEKHPLYPDEWKKFWNRRYKELQLEKKDPNKHDFKPEWIVFWTKRMKELHDEEIEKKKIEIKKKIGLPEIGEEKTDQLKKQYKIKAPVKSERAQVIDISDDEESLSIHPKKMRTATTATAAAIAAEKKQPEIKKQSEKANSLSRSLSPLSDDEFDNKKVKKASRFSDREREHSTSSRDRYAPPDYYRHPREWPRGYYPPPPGHYGYRTMDAYSYPQYEPPKKEEEEEPDDEPLTVVSVLRLLTALEDHLGSLGPKVVDLLAKALALEKVKANSADELLLNEDHSVFFETVKEKLKGQLIAHVLDTHKIKAVKKAIKNIAAIIHLVNEKAAKKLEEGEENKVEEMKEVKKPKAPPAKELPFDRQLIASKLAAALVMQERTDISTEDMDRLIQSFILMVKVSKERNEIIYVKDMLLELGIVTEELVEEQIEEAVMEEAEEEEEEEGQQQEQQQQQQQQQEAEEELEKEITVDMFDINEEEQEESVPQPATALESLTDSDLQTLLQNFKHLSSEEQHHLIAHLKKLESTDPVRVEKLRKFVDISNLQQQGLEKEKTPPKSVAKESPPKKTSTNLYSDDEDEKLQKMIDSDDDDYNFEDVVKIASNNVKEKRKSDERRRPESISRDRDEDASNLSKASSNSVANLNMSLADTQNLIANLMGSLQKNSASFANLKPSTSKETNTTSLNIPTLISHSNNTTNQNANISYQKQPSQQQQQQLQQKQQQQQQLQLKQQQQLQLQQKQQQQQLQQKQQQQQLLQQNQQQQLQQKQQQQQQQQSIPQIRQENQNINRMNPANSNNFLQDNFNIANMQNIGYNPQNPANNFNTYNPFTNFPQQQPQMQPLQQTQILQDFILKQQNFRAQKHQSGSNF